MSGRDSFPPSVPGRDPFERSDKPAEDPTADEWLFAVLSAGDRPGEPGDRVAELLADWRDELSPETTTIPPLLRAAIDERFVAEPVADRAAPAQAVHVGGGGTLVRPRPARRKFTMALAGVSMTVAVAGGVMVAAADAGPGSVLWPVAQAVYGEDAGAAKVGSEVDELLTRAEDAGADGNLDAAMALIAEAESTANELGAGDARDDLLDRCSDIREQLIQSSSDGDVDTGTDNGHAAGGPGGDGSESSNGTDPPTSPGSQSQSDQSADPSTPGSPSGSDQTTGGSGDGNGDGDGDGDDNSGGTGGGDDGGASEDPPTTPSPTNPATSQGPSSPGQSGTTGSNNSGGTGNGNPSANQNG